MVYVMTPSPIHVLADPERPHILRPLGLALGMPCTTPSQRKELTSKVDQAAHPVAS